MSTVDDKRKARRRSDNTEPELSYAERIEEDKGIILDHFLDFIGEDGNVDEVCRFLIHCGITGNDITRAGGNWGVAVLRNYLTIDGYDMEKAGQDLATFPPVAARLEELKDEAEYRKEWEANQRRGRRQRVSIRSISADVPK